MFIMMSLQDCIQATGITDRGNTIESTETSWLLVDEKHTKVSYLNAVHEASRWLSG